jgi:hypothetical protein
MTKYVKHKEQSLKYLQNFAVLNQIKQKFYECDLTHHAKFAR